MVEHAGIQIQLQRHFQGVRATALVARFLEHAEGPIVTFDLIVGTIHILPFEADDHLLELVFGQFLQRPGEEWVGLVVGVIDHPGTPIASLLRGNVFVEESVELLVESTQQRQFGRHLKHQFQVVFVLVAQFVFFADDEILMLPDEGGLLFLGHPLPALTLLSGFFGGTTAFAFAAFVPLPLDLVFDGAHPVQNQLVDVFDDMKQTQLRGDPGPMALQTVLVEGRAIGNRHHHLQPPLLEPLQEGVHVLLVVFLYLFEGDGKVPQGIGGKQDRLSAVVHFIHTHHPREVRQHKLPVLFGVDLLMRPQETVVEIAHRQIQTEVFGHPLLYQPIRHAISDQGVGHHVAHFVGILPFIRHPRNRRRTRSR